MADEDALTGELARLNGLHYTTTRPFDPGELADRPQQVLDRLRALGLFEHQRFLRRDLGDLRRKYDVLGRTEPAAVILQPAATATGPDVLAKARRWLGMPGYGLALVHPPNPLASIYRPHVPRPSDQIPLRYADLPRGRHLCLLLAPAETAAGWRWLPEQMTDPLPVEREEWRDLPGVGTWVEDLDGDFEPVMRFVPRGT